MDEKQTKPQFSPRSVYLPEKISILDCARGDD
jgi:hypothetical protein